MLPGKPRLPGQPAGFCRGAVHAVRSVSSAKEAVRWLLTGCLLWNHTVWLCSQNAVSCWCQKNKDVFSLCVDSGKGCSPPAWKNGADRAPLQLFWGRQGKNPNFPAGNASTSLAPKTFPCLASLLPALQQQPRHGSSTSQGRSLPAFMLPRSRSSPPSPFPPSYQQPRPGARQPDPLDLPLRVWQWGFWKSQDGGAAASLQRARWREAWGLRSRDRVPAWALLGVQPEPGSALGLFSSKRQAPLICCLWKT